jgi:hypothetical protein
MLEPPITTPTRRKTAPKTAKLDPAILDKIARAFAQVGQNLKGTRLIGDENGDNETENVRLVNIRETRYFSAGFAVIGFVLFWIYASFVLVNMNYAHGYVFKQPPAKGRVKKRGNMFVHSSLTLVLNKQVHSDAPIAQPRAF